MLRTTSLILFLVLSNESAQTFAMLENLPTGNYYYENLRSERVGNQYIVLRKVGHVVVGVDVQSRLRNPCFKGFVEQNSIVDATRIFPPYDPASKWEHRKGEVFNLDSYRRIEQTFTASDNTALQKCLRVFSE